MPEHLRAFAVVIVLSATVLAALRRSLEPLMPEGAYVRRRNIVLALLASAFLAPNFWVYALVACLILLRARRFEAGSALFFAVLYVVPPSASDVPGFGLANFLLSIDHPRLVALMLLVPLIPAAWRAQRVGGTALPDFLVLAYLLLQVGLTIARDESFTNGLRGAVYVVMGIGLPYFVVSRTLSKGPDVKDALALMCMTGAVLGAIGVFEAARHWLLFKGMIEHWGPNLGMANYLGRSGVVRASATTGQPIVLGYVLMVAYACFLGLRSEMRGARKLGCGLLLLGGLLATVSRGPWMGCAVAIVMFWAAAKPVRFKLVLVASLVLLFMLVVLDIRLAPSALKEFDKSTVDYRAQLLDASLAIFRESPWFGSGSFRRELAQAGLVQGQGIVDVVNSYVQIALSSGIVGLALFGAAFLSVIRCVRQAAKTRVVLGPPGSSPDGSPVRSEGGGKSETGRVLIAVLAGTIVTIATVSSISFIPWTYWAFLGAGVAFARAAAKNGHLKRIGEEH